MKFNFLPETKNSVIDLPFLSLLIANVITIFFAITEHWSILTVMWIYWFQSVVIGFFNFVRILQLKEFSTEGVKINRRPALPTSGTKIYIAFFFLFHYGFFHFGYALFLASMGGTSHDFLRDVGGQNYIYLTATLFFINHLISYIFNRPKDTKMQNIGTLMFYPYARIIPMHLTIVFGNVFFQSFLAFFLVLKMFADLIMHVVEHKLRKGEESLTSQNLIK